MALDSQRARSVFLAALDCAGKEREALLGEACAGDAELRQRVDRLLQAHDRPDSLPEAPGPEGPTADSVSPEEKPLVPGLGGSAERPGTVIGPYKLVQEIGEGGMGTVFLAQQTQPVKRLVALKLIKPGMDSRQVIARFEAERQALALMEHPNIAKVFDAGTTERGRPYFVMELVKGVPITRYCDEHRLTPRQRLELFIPVCQAIQHAHQKGIIHRDIKPTNVLVALYDGKPVPKVIDFGIAKAAGQQLTERTLVTGFGAVVGTLEYMSPEQAELNQLDIDTRSDIYSLGVLLYELLTGSTPLERKRLKAAAMLECLRLIREEEPPKPSTRLSTTDEMPSVAANRGLEPKKLSGLVRGELDWIVMKTLEKDRNRRYETANGLAMDVQRYLADESVLACPPSAWYRFRKFARRKKAALGMAACVLLALAGIAGGLGWAVRDRLAREDEIEHQEAQRRQDIERKEAQQRNEIDRQVQRALDEAGALMDKASWLEAMGALGRATKLLDAAGRQDRPPQLQELQKDLDMAQRLEAIYSQTMAGDATGGQNSPEQGDRYAQEFQRYGIDVPRLPVAEAAARVRERSICRELARALDSWSREEAWASRIPANRNRQPVDWKRLLQVAMAADPDPWRVKLRLALGQVGIPRRNQVQDLAASAEVAQLPPATLYLLGTALYDTGSPTQAFALLRQAQVRYPDDWPLNNILGRYYNGSYSGGLPQPDEALRYYTVAQALRPQNPYTPFAIGRILRQKKNGHTEALAVWSRALELKPDNLEALRGRADAQEGLGRWVNALADWSRLIELEPKQAYWLVYRANCYASLQQWDKALVDYTKAIKLDPNNPISWGVRARVYTSQKQWDKALADYTKAIELDPKNLNLWRQERARWYVQLKQWDKALADYTKAIELDPKHNPPVFQRASCYENLKQWDKAIADYTGVIEVTGPANGRAVGQRAFCYEQLPQWDKAIADYSKLIELDAKNGWELPLHLAQRASCYENLKQWDKAIADYTKVIELKLPAFQRRALGPRAFCYEQLQQWDKAIADYSKVIELEPRKADAWSGRGHNGLAWLLATAADPKVRDPVQAVKLAKKAVELQPKEGTYWNTLGVAHFRAGDCKATLAALDESMKLRNGGDALDWFFMAMFHEKLGDKEKARQWYNRAVEWMHKNNPKDEELRRLRSEAAELLKTNKGQ